MRLSTTANRLLCGLCISDMISSLGLMPSTLPLPNAGVKLEENLIWNGRGTTLTCDIFGIITLLGTAAAPLYNCSLCLYSLSIIKYNLAEKDIQKKLEVWFHAVPILFSVGAVITVQLNEAFNPVLTVCWIAPKPLSCFGDESIECERGENFLICLIIFTVIPLLVLPCVIVVSMTMMYASIRKHEKLMDQYSSSNWANRIKKRRKSEIIKQEELRQNPVLLVDGDVVTSGKKVEHDINTKNLKNEDVEEEGKVQEEEEEGGKEKELCEQIIKSTTEEGGQGREEHEHHHSPKTTTSHSLREGAGVRSESYGQGRRNSESLTSMSHDHAMNSIGVRRASSSWLLSHQSSQTTNNSIVSRRGSLFHGINDDIESIIIKNKKKQNAQESRIMFFRACAYSMAYFATYSLYIVVYVFMFLDKEPGVVLEIIFRIFTPLQGFFNFLVYMHQRITHVKHRSTNDNSITWRKAVIIALQSRGAENPPERRSTARF